MLLCIIVFLYFSLHYYAVGFFFKFYYYDADFDVFVYDIDYYYFDWIVVFGCVFCLSVLYPDSAGEHARRNALFVDL